MGIFMGYVSLPEAKFCLNLFLPYEFLTISIWLDFFPSPQICASHMFPMNHRNKSVSKGPGGPSNMWVTRAREAGVPFLEDHPS